MHILRVFYVKKVTKGPDKGEITHIGGISEAGENWSISIQEAIDGIMNGRWEFYLVEKSEKIKVNICTLNDSETFLSAKGQGYLHNLLEDLPECSLVFQI